MGGVNDTQRGRTMFYAVPYRNEWLAASDLFDMFTQPIKFYYTFHYHVLRVQMSEKRDSSNSRNEWLLLPASFTAKLGLVFVLTLENAFC